MITLVSFASEFLSLQLLIVIGLTLHFYSLQSLQIYILPLFYSMQGLQVYVALYTNFTRFCLLSVKLNCLNFTFNFTYLLCVQVYLLIARFASLCLLSIRLNIRCANLFTLHNIYKSLVLSMRLTSLWFTLLGS